MYRVLIADDELPALRYMRSLIQQFSSQFQIVDAVISGEAALKVLQGFPARRIIITPFCLPSPAASPATSRCP